MYIKIRIAVIIILIVVAVIFMAAAWVNNSEPEKQEFRGTFVYGHLYQTKEKGKFI